MFVRSEHARVIMDAEVCKEVEYNKLRSDGSNSTWILNNMLLY